MPPSQPVVDGIDQRQCAERLSMHDEGMPRRLPEMPEPVEQCGLVGMRRQAPDGMDARTHRHPFAEQRDLLRPIDQPATERTRDATSRSVSTLRRKGKNVDVLRSPGRVTASGWIR